MNIRRNNQIFCNTNCLQPMIVIVNGAKISIATQEDALCYLYTINHPLKKKDPKKKKKEFTYLRQEKFLFWHLEQLRRWIIIMVSRKKRPSTINASWKVD